MQIGVSALFLALCYVFALYNRVKLPLASYLSFTVASSFLMLIGLYLLKLKGVEDPSWFVVYVAFSSLVWIFTGIGSRIATLHFCGWLGLIFVYGFILHYYLGSFNWLENQLSWVSFAVLLGWAGWLLHRYDKMIGMVFLSVACLLWFGPEVINLTVLGSHMELLQAALIVKIIVAGFVLFIFRKKWTEWIA